MNGKIALGALGGIGLITTVSVVSSRSGSSDPSWAKGIPSFSFLYKDETFMTVTPNNSSFRFGYKYAGLLVSDIGSNDDWWKWSYKNLEDDKPLGETFTVADVSIAVPDSVDSLKSWCKTVYEKDTESHEPLDESNSIFNNASVWKYCSPIQIIPVSLVKSGATYSKGTIGKTIEKMLLSLEGNDRIWHYRNKFFNGIRADEFSDDPNLAILKEGRKNGRKIKDICTDIYKKSISEFHPDFFVFCAISQTSRVLVETERQ